MLRDMVSATPRNICFFSEHGPAGPTPALFLNPQLARDRICRDSMPCRLYMQCCVPHGSVDATLNQGTTTRQASFRSLSNALRHGRNPARFDKENETQASEWLRQRWILTYTTFKPLPGQSLSHHRLQCRIVALVARFLIVISLSGY